MLEDPGRSGLGEENWTEVGRAPAVPVSGEGHSHRNLPFKGLHTNPPCIPFSSQNQTRHPPWEVFIEHGFLSVTIVFLFLNQERQACFHLKFTPTFLGASSGTCLPCLLPGEGPPRDSGWEHLGHADLQEPELRAPVAESDVSGRSGSCRDTGLITGAPALPPSRAVRTRGAFEFPCVLPGER